MPINRIKPTLPSGEREKLSSDTASNFSGRKVYPDDTQNTISETQSYSNLDGNKSIHERSTLPSSSDALSVDLDNQDDISTFYSAVDFLEDKFPEISDVSIESELTAEQPQINAIDDGQATVNQEAVEHLENADSQRLSQYIDDFCQVYQDTSGSHGIAVNLREPLQAMVDYGTKIDADMGRLEALGQKLQIDGLSGQESLEMKALMHCNKYNLSLVQSWLSATSALKLKAGTMNEPTATLFMALSNRFAMRHMNLADTVSLYEDRLPTREPLSRNDRIEYSLLTARAGLRAFKTMTYSQKRSNPDAFNEMKKIYPSLVKHCKELERAARVAKGQIKMDADDPQLEIESLKAWTEDFDLTADKEQSALPRKVMDQLTHRWDEEPPTLALNHPQLSQRNMTCLYIEHQLKKAGVDMAQLPKFENAYEQAFTTEINENEWPIINRSLPFETDGKRHTCRSEIVPGAHLAQRFEKPYKSNGVGHMDRLQTEHVPNIAHTRLIAEDGKTLFSGVRHGILDAYDYNDKKVRSLSDAQLTKMAEAIYDDRQKSLRKVDTSTLEQQLEALEGSEDSDELITLPQNANYFGQSAEEPETVAKRSVEKRYLEKQIELRDRNVQEIVGEIKSNPAKRAHYADAARNLASRNMASEVLSAAIVSDPAKLDAALAGETVDVTMNSVALVTPDWLRSRALGSASTDERRMLQQQVQALQSLASEYSPDNPVRLMIKDDNGQPKEIKVNLKVRTFNFGVNNYALAKTVLPANFPIWRNLMGWGFSANLNNPQLNELLGPRNRTELGGAVAEKLQQLEQSEDPKIQKRAVLLREASTQAKAIWRNRSFWSGNNEPYKMVSRLALTSHLMDESTLFNCKSGKDRTGQLDAEVKYLAAVGHATGHIPEPDSEHTAESRRMRTTFTLDAGNMEIQRMNTGLPGYKLRNIPGLEAMREAGTKGVYEGGSDLV